ncbi:hypothetical protein Ddye_018280 [Dipteronia dyeriana]|uniref:Uncharacterized protein n=1 Tax=Dipteronia dyeriana TaxID=168575 RepID=A0AAD9X1B0_9ROSI|nr:hypothetical protein Ddye_018280 [Dipteronia dyeriana]
MDKKSKTVMVSVVLFLIAFAIIFTTVWRQQPNPKPVLPVDHLWIDFIYPPGYCLKQGAPCLNPERAKTPLFTIHGQWPVDVNGRNVPGDPNARDADINDIKSNPTLRDEMEVYWPSVNGFNLEDDFKFWSKEWKNHGSADPTNNNDAILYFTKTMAVRKLPGGNLSAALEKKKCKPWKLLRQRGLPVCHGIDK